MTDKIIYSIYTRDPLNKNAELGECLVERDTREEAISAAQEHLREEMLEQGDPCIGHHDKEAFVIWEDALGEHQIAVTLKWKIDYNDLYGLDMRSEHFNQKDYI